MFYPLASDSWGGQEIQAIQDVIASGRFTYGPRIQEFEEKFAQKYGVKHAVMVNSGSSANLIGVAALCFKEERPLKPGDEVIVPAIAWSTTYSPLQQYGLKIKIVDVDLHTLNMNPDVLEAAIGPKTRMIMAVSVLGNPCALDQIRALCDKHDLYLFEDNCESQGAELKGEPTGTFGDIGTFSFFFSHHISTIEGGMLITNNTELAHLAIALRSHGWTRSLPDESPIYTSSGNDFYEAYRFILPGYNVRATEIQGATGLIQLEKLDEMVRVRRKNAALFKEITAQYPGLITQTENGSSSWFSFAMVLDPKLDITRDHITDKLKAADIEFRVIAGGNVLRHDVIKYFDYETVGEITQANIAHERGFFIGNHAHDLEPQLMKLKEVLDSCFQ